ncbi:MAG: threonine--tRNA ligase [Spirochaetaceae bacterium]|jgi:threonyl-tRNA synthetase|nr:threonine--tRNA ligase [Spirochaetaceae bacterium]
MQKIQDDDFLFKMRHSAQHVLSYAIELLYPGTKKAMGPATGDGFYGDFELPAGVSIPVTDLPVIEKKMEEIINKGSAFIRQDISIREAKELFKDNKYKLEWLDRIEERKETANVYWTGEDFVDLCAGPHVDSVKDIKAFKLLSIAGAYWHGDSKNIMLTRIYGTAYLSLKELKEYLHLREEAEKRDHRKLGPALNLIYFDSNSPGAPYWLPNGLILYKELYNYWSYYHEDHGYIEYRAPLINRKELFEISGHWAHYHKNMFIINEDEHNTLVVKPMGCPNALVVFGLQTRSYQDLPFRLSDADMLYRKENTGALTGLFRTYEFNQDDAHIFITENQIESEYNNIINIVEDFYNLFGLKCSFSLSTRPDDFMGDIETWNKAEDILKQILTKRFGKDGFEIKEKDGAFYGPKLDIMMKDCLSRYWQLGTIQLDFQLPQKFNSYYIDENGERKTPILLHRVIYGALGRFIGVLIEHFSGKFPLWLCPVHAVIIPISEAQREYSDKIYKTLVDVEIRTATRGLRINRDYSQERFQKRIRNAQIQYIPYMIILGEKEAGEGSISVRTRDNKQFNNISLESFIAGICEKIKTKSLEI